jgi:hypothetical protein
MLEYARAHKRNLAAIAIGIITVLVYLQLINLLTWKALDRATLELAVDDVAVAWTNAQTAAHHSLKSAPPSFIAQQNSVLAGSRTPCKSPPTWQWRWPPVFNYRYAIRVVEIRAAEGVSRYVLRCGSYGIVTTTAWPEGAAKPGSTMVYSGF